MKTCDLCNEIKNNNFEYAGKKYGCRVLYATENFLVVPSLGQLVDGHLLIITKNHFVSMAELPSELFLELEEIKDKVRYFLRKNYCEPIFFEHGVLKNTDKENRYVGHARLHALPVKIGNLTVELNDYFFHKRLNKHSEIISFVDVESSYLFFENNEGVKEGFFVSHIIPDQFLRKIVMKQANFEGEWDWKKNPKIDSLFRIVKKFKKEDFEC